MCNGASHVDSFPEPYFDDTGSYASDADDEAEGEEEKDSEDAKSGSAPSVRTNLEVLAKFKELPGARAQDKELHLRRIAGLDIQDSVLKEAIEATAPPPIEPSPFASYYAAARQRWEDLRVEIWQGSLDVYNDAFDNFEAIIMTEVIEHLYDKALHKFPDIVFGDYRPRIVVVTTPNHDFNHFLELGKSRTRKRKTVVVPDETADQASAKGTLDPTGRTDRRFRDDDHKFEWTQAEFKTWVDSIIAKYDYDVEMTGVGSLRNFFGKGGIPSAAKAARPASVAPAWVREVLASVPDADKFFATQIAVFHRKFAYEAERTPRSPAQAPLAFYGAGPKKLQPGSKLRSGSVSESPTGHHDTPGVSPNHQQHKLLKSHYYKASSATGHAKKPKEIRAVLDELMRERMRMRSVSLRELWGREEVASACGGYINKIMEAVIQDPSKEKQWDIDFKPELLERGMMEDAVFLVLKGFEEPQIDWADEGEDEEQDDENDTAELEGRVQNMMQDDIDRDPYEHEEDEEDGAGTSGPKAPVKTKRQLKAERKEQMALEAERKAAERAEALKERIWVPEEGDDTWAAWDREPPGQAQEEKEVDWDTSKRTIEGGWGSD